MFVKIKIFIFVITIYLKYTEIKKSIKIVAERGTAVFHPKRWDTKESGECNIMQAFILCTPNQTLVNNSMFMTQASAVRACSFQVLGLLYFNTR